METRLSNLVAGTQFTYEGKQYLLHSDSTFNCQETDLGEGDLSFSCAPFLGGQYQTKPGLLIRIRIKTIVHVDS